MNSFPRFRQLGQNARTFAPSGVCRGWSRIAAGVLGFLLGLAWSQPAGGAEPILSWAGAERDPHPCLYVTAKDLARFKATAKNLPELAAQKSFNLGGGLEQAVTAALLTGNPAAERAVLQGALSALDTLLANIPRTTRDNVGPHAYAQFFGQAVGLADAALAAKFVGAEDRAKLRAKIAQVCYAINDPKYFNPEAAHGSLCPNMFTSAAGYRLTAAALIPSHPLGKKWFDDALAELRQEVEDWVDPQGGMAECPHYAMVILDQWVGAFLIAKNAGAADAGNLFNPRLRKAIEWFGNISTPRDPRSGGFRRLPSYGHTYANERTSMFGVMACLWKDTDPAFAAQLEWMHREHGSFGEPGILSYYPAFMAYRNFFRESGVTPKPPAWGSQYYQETGVQLRNGIGSDRETMLYMIAGRFHSHYFNDSGAIALWGKGRELCDDDDYQRRRAKESREAHSMPDKPATFNEERVMELREFSTAPHLDYVSGVRRGWQRQIAFVKDADPLAPNYFVIADTLDAKSAPTIWRLFLAAQQITPTAMGVTMTGRDDVDMDIFFLQPGLAKPQIHTNHISLAVEKSGTVTVVLYPRLRTEKPPEVSPLDGGQGVRVVTAAGTDIIYLTPGPRTARPDEGKVSLVKQRGGQTVRVVPGACDIVRNWWTDGDPQLRQIKWKKGPQYPPFPDYEDAVSPNPGNLLLLERGKPAVATDFLLAQGAGKPAQATDVAVGWDDDGLDVTFQCVDSGIVAAFKDNDNIKLWKDDCVYVWLDPGHTHNSDRKYIMIQVSASGAWHDLKNGDPTFNVQGLKADVARTARGWSARLRVPWKGLGEAAPKPGDVWGVNFTRMDQPGKVDLDNMQMSSWAALPYHPGDPTDLLRWGHLVFGGKDDSAVRKAHQAIIDSAYTRERLLK